MSKYLIGFAAVLVLALGAGCQKGEATKAQRVSFLQRSIESYDRDENSQRYADEIANLQEELAQLEASK